MTPVFQSTYPEQGTGNRRKHGPLKEKKKEHKLRSWTKKQKPLSIAGDYNKRKTEKKLNHTNVHKGEANC